MDKIQLHLGCDKRYLKNYVHIDLADYPHIDFHHNVKTLPMFKDNTVDLIYASHIVEYFDRFEVNTFIQMDNITFGTREYINYDYLQRIIGYEFENTPFRIEYRRIKRIDRNVKVTSINTEDDIKQINLND